MNGKVYAYATGNPVSIDDPTGLWSITFGGYLGAGGEFTFGSDNGHLFATGRIGVGIGVGASYDPHGEVPGGTDTTGCQNGAVLSASAEGGINLGPLGGQLEVGAERNYATDESHVYGGPSFNVASDVEGFHFGASIGAQLTFYGGKH